VNRYSLLFALLVASSFAVQSPQSGDSNPPARDTAKAAAEQPPAPINPGPESFIKAFLAMAQHGPASNPQVLFVTVPHPLETHLPAAFDNNVDALEDGLQDAGYLFDSAMIPWKNHGSRDQFDDDEKEKNAKLQEDDVPGILLFRNGAPGKDRYADGLIVFLFTEKPTGGIARVQAQNAAKILGGCGISLGKEMRILGPTFSGSFASLVPVVGDLLKAGKQTDKVLIRSGGVSVIEAAQWAVDALAPTVKVDFGSANHDNRDEIALAESAFAWMGIDRPHIALLSEGQSLYGRLGKRPGGTNKKPVGDEANPKEGGETVDPVWRIAFPRDISALRAGYEKQGVFDSSAQAQPWRRFLNPKAEEQGQGDKVRQFGKEATTLAQESVLFAISEFLKAHRIRAVIIRATNTEDRHFLTQFLHANNTGVRIAMLGATRAFMRGSTAQFRGDMLVGDLPMLPLLHDWTGRDDDHAARIFADDLAEGTYYAAVDLFKEPTESAPESQNPGSTPQSSSRQFKWYPEFSEPNWGQNPLPVLRPPMYVVALGSNATWPIAMEPESPSPNGDPGRLGVKMPFTLFEHDLPTQPQAPTPSQKIHIAFAWGVLLLAAVFLTVAYCLCFWYANPVTRIAFASFAPSSEWRFWLFKVAIPAAVAGSVFRVLAWAVEMPVNVSPGAFRWWHYAEAMTVAAPLGIAASALIKALVLFKLAPKIWMWISLAPSAVAAMCLPFSGFFANSPFADRDVGSILNTYREMHWESGLSLVPTGLLFLLAILVWASQAGNGGALFEFAPVLPEITSKSRISRTRAAVIQALGRPLPDPRVATWLWAVWFAFAGSMAWAHYHFSPFLQITTLESYAATNIVRGMAGAIGALIFLDVLQFFRLWGEFRGFLQALDRETFRRSFVPIHDFNWRNLWSITGTSLSDRRGILSAQVDCVSSLRGEAGFAGPAATVEKLHNKYGPTDLSQIDSETYRKDLRDGYDTLAAAAVEAFALIESQKNAPAQPLRISPEAEAIQRVLACQCKGDGGRFSDEAEELARLPDTLQTAEKLLCLMYIGFIQTVVARLHTLLVSVASMFSLVTLGLAIYPFVPFYPLLLTGLVFLMLIGWAFFKVFSEMDTDPILSRIVNGDDRKLQGNFYLRFAEAIALPLLTLGSSILPGGAGRLLELAQSLLNHAQ
jgi:hypothetical protein